MNESINKEVLRRLNELEQRMGGGDREVVPHMTNMRAAIRNAANSDEGGASTEPGEPFTNEMSGEEFKAIREGFGFTQERFAKFLGYSHKNRVSEFERPKLRRVVPDHLARLVRAYAEGYRPGDWPEPDMTAKGNT